ncbi:MAG: arginine--tRNA ligase [Thermoproteota archaeon]|nr:MAG: arginine--tRNA ligase [Candidatus Korarchaeota archaeon]
MHLDPLNEVRRAFADNLSKVIKDLYSFDIKVTVSRVPNLNFGDLGSPVAFELAKILKKEPNEISNQLSASLDVSSIPYAHSSDAKGGFVNLKLNRKDFAKAVIDSTIKVGPDFGSSLIERSRVMVEHTSANPVHPLHVGSGRNAVIGDTFANILEKLGFEVSRHYLVNDSGRQASLLVYARSRLPDAKVEGKPDHWYGVLYAACNCIIELKKRRGKEAEEWKEALEELRKRAPDLVNKLEEEINKDENPEASVAELNKKYQEGKDEVVKAMFREVTEAVMEGFKQTLERLGIRHDAYDWESELIWGGWIDKALQRLKKSGYLEKEDGAYYVNLLKAAEEREDIRKVLGGNIEEIRTKMPPVYYLSRSDGTWLYTGTDVGYSLYKFEGLKEDKVYNVIGVDQKLAQLQLRAAMALMGIDPNKLVHFSYEFVDLPEVKMSGRRGRYVTIDELLDEAKKRVKDLLKERVGIEEKEVEEIAEKVAVGAIRYALINVIPSKKVIFTWDRVLNLQENSGPFIQYAYTRTRGILRKAGEVPEEFDASHLGEEIEIELIYKIAELPETIRNCYWLMRPDILAQYANDLAMLINKFYEKCPVIAAPKGVREARTALVKAASIALGNAMDILGIPRLDKM